MITVYVAGTISENTEQWNWFKTESGRDTALSSYMDGAIKGITPVSFDLEVTDYNHALEEVERHWNSNY